MCPPSLGVHRMQPTLHRIMRSIIGVARTAIGVPMAPISRELSIAPILASPAASRARAFLKAPRLGTYIRDLAIALFRSRSWVWTNGTVRWLNRWAKWPNVSTSGTTHVAWATDMEPHALATRVRDTVWDRADNSVTAGLSMMRYSSSSFPSLLSIVASLPLHLVPAVPLLIQLRTRAFPTARRLAKARSLPERFLT